MVIQVQLDQLDLARLPERVQDQGKADPDQDGVLQWHEEREHERHRDDDELDRAEPGLRDHATRANRARPDDDQQRGERGHGDQLHRTTEQQHGEGDHESRHDRGEAGAGTRGDRQRGRGCGPAHGHPLEHTCDQVPDALPHEVL